MPHGLLAASSLMLFEHRWGTNFLLQSISTGCKQLLAKAPQTVYGLAKQATHPAKTAQTGAKGGNHGAGTRAAACVFGAWQ